jgi:hypothetical protein
MKKAINESKTSAEAIGFILYSIPIAASHHCQAQISARRSDQAQGSGKPGIARLAQTIKK